MALRPRCSDAQSTDSANTAAPSATAVIGFTSIAPAMPSSNATRSRTVRYCVGPPTKTMRSTSCADSPAFAIASRTASIDSPILSWISASSVGMSSGTSM